MEPTNRYEQFDALCRETVRRLDVDDIAQDVFSILKPQMDARDLSETHIYIIIQCATIKQLYHRLRAFRPEHVTSLIAQLKQEHEVGQDSVADRFTDNMTAAGIVDRVIDRVQYLVMLDQKGSRHDLLN